MTILNSLEQYYGTLTVLNSKATLPLAKQNSQVWLNLPDIAARLYLEAVTDPEHSEKTEQVLFVDPANYSPEEAHQRFLDMSRSWWREARRQLNDNLLIIVHYKSAHEF